MPDKPSLEFSQAPAVFKGQVIEKWDKHNAIASVFEQVGSWIGIPPNYGYNVQAYGYRVEFMVLTSWKGITTTTIDVNTGYGGGDCGYPFQIGTQYVVYSYTNGSGSNELFTSICSRTTHLAVATEDLTYLNSLPVLPLVAVTAPSETPWLLICAAAMGLVVLLMTMLLLYRRRKVEL